MDSPLKNESTFPFSFGNAKELVLSSMVTLWEHRALWVRTALLPLTDDFEGLQAAVTAMTHVDFQLRPMMSISLFNKTQLCSGTKNTFNDHSSTTSHDTSKLPTGDPFTLHVKAKSVTME